MATGLRAQTHQWLYFNASDTVSPNHRISQLGNLGFQVMDYSTWFNAVCVAMDTNQLPDFIAQSAPLPSYQVHKSQIHQTQETFSYGGSDWQLKMLGLDEYHRRGFTGKGVTIGLFDAGFFKVDSLPAFDTLRKRGQILAEWDFHYNDTNVYIQDGHGMYVLSIAGGYWPDSIMGAAPDANFLLARTEIANREIHAEELAWVKALEWADSIGVDIIHSSLGYSLFDTLEGDYSYMDMDGQSTIITRATDSAAARGIFITNSAGNEGEKEWHHITAPCDGRHVLCVGAVDSNQVHAPFSSYGPSADGRVKPDVMAMGAGVTYVNKEGLIRTGGGTSFSGPLIAGMAACLKQAWPDATNEQLYQSIIKSADRYLNPDTAYGYGLPNVLVADSILKEYVLSARQPLNYSFNLYPNPGKGSVRLSGHDAIQLVRVSDGFGRPINAIYHQDLREIEFASASPGMYVIEVITTDGKKGVQSYLKLE